MNSHRDQLKSRIKQLADLGRKTRVELNALAGKEKHDRRMMYVVTTRFEARHTLLAYAFLRGIPYKAVERKSNEEPSAFKVASILGDGERRPEVDTWLSGKETASQVRTRLGFPPLSEEEQAENLDSNLEAMTA